MSVALSEPSAASEPADKSGRVSGQRRRASTTDPQPAPLTFTSEAVALARVLEQRMDSVCARFGLTWGELSVLVALRPDAQVQAVAPKQLLERIAVSPAGLSNRLSRLESKGLIRRSADEDDKRILPVELTEEGRRRARVASRVCGVAEAAVMASVARGDVGTGGTPTPAAESGFGDPMGVPNVRLPRRVDRTAGAGSRYDETRTRAREDRWPETGPQLELLQGRLARAAAAVSPWQWKGSQDLRDVGAVFVSYGPDPADSGTTLVSAAAVVARGVDVVATSLGARRLHCTYRPMYLALVVGSLLEDVVRGLSVDPYVLFVNGTGGDHDRGAGVAIQLGAAFDVPTIGVTNRPMIAVGPEPRSKAGSWAPLSVGEQIVGCRVRLSARSQPIALHAGWRTTAEAALECAQFTGVGVPVPQPLLRARRLARALRMDLTTTESAS